MWQYPTRIYALWRNPEAVLLCTCIRSFQLLTWCFVIFQGGQCGHDDFIPLTKVDTLGRKANTISTNPSLQMSNKKLPFCLAGFSLKQSIRPWSQVKKTWWRPKVVFYCSNGLKWKGNEELPNRFETIQCAVDSVDLKKNVIISKNFMALECEENRPHHIMLRF